MTSAPVITVVGSLHYDVLVSGQDRPRKGETLSGSDWDWKCGGKGGNQALEAARHGAAVRFVGAVGEDAFGDALLSRLGAGGVDTGAVARLAGARSGMSVAIFDGDGDYGAVIVSGSNWHISLDQPGARAAVATCSVLLIQNEAHPGTNLAAAQAAKRAGATVVLNAAPVRELDDDIAELADILVVNEIEAAAMTGLARISSFKAAEHAAARLLGRFAQVVVTLGGAGLVVACRDRPARRLHGHLVDVASTHGAGDALVGAMAARLASGDSLEYACQYGNAAAAALVATPEIEREKLGPDAAFAMMTASPANN
jgi:ribokinase